MLATATLGGGALPPAAPSESRAAGLRAGRMATAPETISNTTGSKTL